MNKQGIETPFDEILFKVGTARQQGVPVVSSDDHHARTIGFTIEGTRYFLWLSTLMGRPPVRPETAALFGLDNQRGIYDRIRDHAGRNWLATGQEASDA